MATPTQARAPRLFRALFRLLVAREEREPLLAELEAAARGDSRGWWAVQLFGLLRPSILWRLAIRARLVGLERSREPGRLVTSLLDGVRHSVRSVRRNGPVSIAAILILGLGIGAATTLFAVLDAVMLSPLPHPEADRLVQLTSPVLDHDAVTEWRSNDRLFEGLAGFSIRGTTARTGASVELIRTMPVTADFLSLLVHGPVDGRLLRPPDHDPSAPSAVVVSRPFWERHFGPEWVTGRTIELDGRTHTVVGTLPGSFQFGRYRNVDAWHPFEDPGDPMMGLGRLAVGVDIERATRELEQRAAKRADALGLELPPDTPPVRVFGLHEATVGEVRTMLWLLFGTTGLVLLLSCANAANLFLARLLERREELAVRTALGAGPRRLLGQLLGEGVILATLSALVGVGLATGAIALLSGPAAASLPRAAEIAVDHRVLGFSVVASTLTVLLFAFGPALGATRRTAGGPRSGGRGATDGRRVGQLRSALVVLQVALALVLAVGTSLLVRTFVRLNPADPGFAVDGRYVIELDLPEEKYGADPDRTLAFIETLETGWSAWQRTRAIRAPTRATGSWPTSHSRPPRFRGSRSCSRCRLGSPSPASVSRPRSPPWMPMFRSPATRACAISSPARSDSPGSRRR